MSRDKPTKTLIFTSIFIIIFFKNLFVIFVQGEEVIINAFALQNDGAIEEVCGEGDENSFKKVNPVRKDRAR
jgi:hypothetical protein